MKDFTYFTTGRSYTFHRPNYIARNFMTPQYLTSKFSTVAGQHGHATRLAQSSDLKVHQPNLQI